jgi:23S rRNA pseudouridine1911/1915/1917 synthase
MAINKSTGIVCHPAHATQTGTVANAVAFHCQKLSRGEDPFRPGIVHRLDKNTTGVLLIAKSDEAHWRISLQFERRTIRKEYFAICAGAIALDADVINKPLAPHPATTQKMVLPDSGPPRQAMFKEAITEYRVNTRYRGFTTVDLFPKTGRTHQLRLHMASIGHPMLGDRLYGGPSVTEADLTGTGSLEPLLEYQALHARCLRFVHPILEKPLTIEAPIPDRLTRVLALLDEHRAAR